MRYRSPRGAPTSPGSPSPASRTRMPESTPAGTFTLRLRVILTTPAPRHVPHGDSTIVPRPRHLEQVRATAKNPWLTWTWPRPLQVSHVFGLVPAFAPDPSHVAHRSIRSKLILRSPPSAASSRLRS